MAPPDKASSDGPAGSTGAAPPRASTPVPAADPPPGARAKRVDSLLRAFLYVAQQLGRPISEAELRTLAPVPDSGMDERAFLLACERVGFRAGRAAVSIAQLEKIPTPFVLVGDAERPSWVVVSREGGDFTVLDVVEGRTTARTAAAVAALSGHAIMVREAERRDHASHWKDMLRVRVRQVAGELLAASFVINILALATPLFMMVIFNRVIGQGNPDTLGTTMIVLMIGMSIAYIFDLLLRILRGYVSSHTGSRIDALMSGEVVRRLVHLPYRHFEKTPSGVISERLRQLDTLRSFFTGQMPSLIIDLGFVIVYLAAIFLINWPIGLFVLLAIPFFIAISLVTHNAQKRHIDENFHALAAKSSALSETVNNAATIKALGLESEIEKRWGARVARSAWTGYRANNLANVVASVTGVLQLFVSLGVILLGTWELVEQRMSIGALIAANMLAGRALAPMRQVISAWHTLQAVKSAFVRIDEMMQIAPEIEPGVLPPMPPIAGEIAFERVSFRYDDDAPPVLQDVDLRIEAGSVIGIIGPSGSGKTTVANLIQGLYKPTAGRILVDKTDIGHMSPAQLRSQIGSVPQDVQLFAGTVRENIAMGVADKDPGRIVAVAKFVGAHNFIQRLPQGYNTVLGERGGGLSTGQKQLLCIARALIRNPRIIVLDEATSALDPATEEQLLRTLRSNARGRTIVMVTHRLAPLAIADKVALIIDGRVERFGPPTEVMAYARIRMAEASRGQPAPSPAPGGIAGMAGGGPMGAV
ncbi:MAG: peptidase domain-containing ABC transporter [Rhodospirillales bacterium]|nr:MAG: peptidase domain-containing ABC transporter [Rhodospirillales bacterium]